MIARNNRFWGKSDIDKVYRNSKNLRSDMLSLRVAEPKYDYYRLAVVVSKKVNKSAVVRNRIRRRLYEQVRLMDKNGKIVPKDMILSVYDDKLARMPHAELSTICESLFAKINK